MKARAICRSFLPFFLVLLILTGICATGQAENSAAMTALSEEAESDRTSSPDEDAVSDDWETRLLLMLAEHDANPETIGAGYYNFVTGEEHYFNGDLYRVSGSMYKVPLNMLFLDWVDDGTITMDESIGGYRYVQLLEGTIIDSNNDYARMLWDYAGATIETNPASTLYHRYRILIAPFMGEDPDNVDDKYYENNFFTPRQMITCLRHLYEGREKYESLIGTMQRAEPEKYFKLRERRFNIAHKYGWFAEDPVLYLNDCALCFTDEPIAIVLFTTGTENAYGVLADFCTLMCDYAQETHAERVEREKEEAAAAELAAEQERLASETASAKSVQTEALPTSTVLPSAETPTVPKQNDSWLHELALGPIVALGMIAAGTLAMIIWFSVRHRRSRLNLLYGFLAILLTAAAAIMCFPGMNGRNYVELPEEDPTAAVEKFFDALMSGDTAVADACLAYEAETGLSLLPADEMHGAAFRALKESWNYALLGECSVDKANAWQEIQLQVLDFSKMEKELQTETRIQLLELARGMNREDVYDEGGNYRPAVAERAYDQAMINLLQNAQNFYSTIGCRVELILTGDGWKIIPTKSLISALSGNLG